MANQIDLEVVLTWYDERGAGAALVLLHGGYPTHDSVPTLMPVRRAR